MKSRVYLLALPLLSITACLDMSDQDAADVTASQASQASLVTLDPAAVTAASGVGVCESKGLHFCVGAPTIAFQDPVEETPSGRRFDVLDFDIDNHHFVAFAFTADPTRCAALKNNSDLVQVRACTNVPSALWAPERGPDGQSCIFRNQEQRNRNNVYLSGHNDGSPFVARPAREPGAFQQFFNPGISCP